MKLLFENWRRYMNEVSMGYDLAKSIEYTAFVLDPEHEGTNSLKEMAPDGWEVYSHHMTMIPPSGKGQRLPSRQFYEGCLKVVGIAKNDAVMTAKVELGEEEIYFKITGIPHVTIATNPEVDGVPSMSNDFTEEDFEVISPIEICGKVEEVLR